MDTNTEVSNLIRVLLVDDHDMSLRGLKIAIDEQNDLQYVGEASTGAAAIAKMQGLSGAVDVIVMDVQMDDGDGIETTTTLSNDYPECRIVLLTYSERYASQARKAGAMGYVLKGSGTESVLIAVRAVHRGALYFEVPPDASSVLTDTEIDVLNLVADGLTNPDIGQRMHRSVSTIGNHIGNIFRKLNVTSREQAVRAAMRQGIIS